jgi:hypothetical protein
MSDRDFRAAVRTIVREGAASIKVARRELLRLLQDEVCTHPQQYRELGYMRCSYCGKYGVKDSPKVKLPECKSKCKVRDNCFPYACRECGRFFSV